MGSQLTDLLAAADAALYRAKRDGRDRVCVVTENATFTGGLPAHGAGRPANGLPPAGPALPLGEVGTLSPEPAG